MDLVDRLERVRLRLAAAYRRLQQEGAITEEQLEAVMEVIDRIEHLPIDEVRRRLQEPGASPAPAGPRPEGEAP